MGPWLRVRDTDSLLLSERTVHCRQGVLSSSGVPSPSRPATALTNCTDVFTMMWMTTSVCMSTAAVARTWILRRDGYGRLLSCVGGAARFLKALVECV